MLSLHDRGICGKILGEIRDGIACDLHGGSRPRIAGGELWEHAGSVIHKIGVETGGLDLLLGQVSSQLVNQRADHLQMPQFLCAGRGSPRATSTKKPCARKGYRPKKRGKTRMCKMPVGSIPLTRTTTIAAPTFTTM